MSEVLHVLRSTFGSRRRLESLNTKFYQMSTKLFSSSKRINPCNLFSTYADNSGKPLENDTLKTYAASSDIKKTHKIINDSSSFILRRTFFPNITMTTQESNPEVTRSMNDIWLDENPIDKRNIKEISFSYDDELNSSCSPQEFQMTLICNIFKICA